MSTWFEVFLTIAVILVVAMWHYALTRIVTLLGEAKAVAKETRTIAERVEAQQQVVAANLAIAQAAVDHVADDLSESRSRADEVVEGQPGEAADAGAQNPKVEGET